MQRHEKNHFHLLNLEYGAIATNDNWYDLSKYAINGFHFTRLCKKRKHICDNQNISPNDEYDIV